MLRIAAAVLLVIGLACSGVASDVRFTEAPILKARVLGGEIPALSDRMPG